MISKVFRARIFRAREKNKLIFLGRQWEGGGFGYHNQILCSFGRFFQFLIQHGHSWFHSFQDISGCCSPTSTMSFFSLFLTLEAIGERKKKMMKNRRQCLHRP